MVHNITLNSERSHPDQVSFIVRFKGIDTHAEYEYDQNTKIGKIREDLFLSPFNNIDNRDRFGLEFYADKDFFDQSETSNSEQIKSIKTQSVTIPIKQIEYFNHMDMFSFKELDTCRLNTLNFKSGKYVLNVYDRSQTTTIYVDRLYRIIGSIIIISLSILFNGLLMRPVLWLLHHLLKLYRITADPYNETKKIKCEYETVFNNGIYEWMFMGIMCYDMYFGTYNISSYSPFCNIGTVLCLYHMIDLFKSYQRLHKSEITARKTHTMKINLLEIMFMIIQCIITWSPYPFIYSALNMWIMLSDLLTTKEIINPMIRSE